MIFLIFLILTAKFFRGILFLEESGRPRNYDCVEFQFDDAAFDIFPVEMIQSACLLETSNFFMRFFARIIVREKKVGLVSFRHFINMRSQLGIEKRNSHRAQRIGHFDPPI